MTGIASKGQLRLSLLRIALLAVPAVMLLGTISGVLSGSADTGWYRTLAKPSFNPPGAAFGIVWPILYFLQGLALSMILHALGAPGRGLALAAFGAQFLLNLLWSPVFFGMREVGAAFYVIIGMIVLTLVAIAAFWRVRRTAALLMLPYLAWICFAAVLNWEIKRLNPELALAGPVADRLA